MFESLKPFLFTFLLLAGGAISIAFSTWQYQVVDNSNIEFRVYQPTGDFSAVDFSYACNHYPLNWMRPFKLFGTDEGRGDSLCGYSSANTGFRLALACVTILCGVWLFFFKNHENVKIITYWGLFGIMQFWAAAAVADIIAVIQGGKSCRQGIEKYVDQYVDCDSAEYGITVAIDVLMCLVMFACWLLAGRDFQDAPAATTASRASFSSSSSSAGAAGSSTALDRM